MVFYSFNLISGTVRGKITNKASGEALTGVVVYLEKDGLLFAKGKTDFDGKYAIKGLTPGTYILTACYESMEQEEVAGIVVVDGKTAYIDLEMIEAEKSNMQENTEVEEFRSKNQQTWIKHRIYGRTPAYKMTAKAILDEIDSCFVFLALYYRVLA